MEVLCGVEVADVVFVCDVREDLPLGGVFSFFRAGSHEREAAFLFHYVFEGVEDGHFVFCYVAVFQ